MITLLNVLAWALLIATLVFGFAFIAVIVGYKAGLL
jgi:hypothetical protein